MQSTPASANPRPYKTYKIGRARAAKSGEDVAQPDVFDQLYIRHPRRWLTAILLAYLLVASLYALLTPPWQAPDEPAHYNYIAHLATTGSLPILRMGDYNQPLLEKAVRLNFPSSFPIEQLRYESYQPPLFYMIATPLFWLTGGSLMALRLFNVILVACAILLFYACLDFVFPRKHLIVLGATGFAALLPMHVAMSAAVNNDGLAELLTVASILALIHWMHDRFGSELADGGEVGQRRERFQLLLLGLLVGLGMLTKIYGHMVLLIVLLVVFVVAWRHPRPQTSDGRLGRMRPAVRSAAWVILPALLLALPMWLRNGALYGVQDLLGLAWHDQVVIGQPRTDQWIAQFGWVAYGERAINLTFRSFWGAFGWLGLFLDQRIYTAFLLFTSVLFMGLLWSVVRLISGEPDTDMNHFQISVLILFGVVVAAVFAGYIWYNAKFVQHQGRYFFWGLLPIGAFVALAWREVLHPMQGIITGLLAAVLAGSLAIIGWMMGSLDKWTIVTISLIALFLLLQPLLLIGTNQVRIERLPLWLQKWAERPWLMTTLCYMRPVAWAMPFILLFVLNVWIPGWFILPQFGPR
ncbi:MAG: phospholipid carrier-dependent glycosyltransferase [Caldilineaceae bacterium]|nr:phospholipid carrier-dependent glycosyltransferase [Caldilineaceae bacterium]